MELVIITAVKSYEKDIKKLLKENGVKAFSHLEVTGYKDLSEEPKEDNWFASGVGEHQSALFYAFIEEAFVDGLLAAISAFNNDQESKSYVHAAVLNIKNSI
jgi:hypothetical protein